MRTQLDQTWNRAAVIGVAALAMFCAAQLALARDKQIEIRGRMLVDDASLADAMLIVEVDDQHCVPFVIESDGHFVLRLPIGSKAQLRFEKPGYLIKEVVIDTHNALNTKRAAKLNKLVRFDVQMSPELSDPQRAYAGPVGIITFLKGSGLMKVLYDRSLAGKPARMTAGR